MKKSDILFIAVFAVAMVVINILLLVTNNMAWNRDNPWETLGTIDRKSVV